MGSKKKKNNIYNYPLYKIFIWSGLDVFIALLIVCAVIALLVGLYGRLNEDKMELMLFSFAMVILFSYTPAMLSLIKLWRQEHILKIYWKDREDFNSRAEDRDWYLSCNRGGFLLYHRQYIKRILSSSVVEQTSDLGRERVHCIKFEDICSKEHTVKFSSLNDEKRFLRWYKKMPYSKNNQAQ